MNNQDVLQSFINFDTACNELGLDSIESLNHFSKNLKAGLEATGFPFLKEDEILYKDGTKITGKEKVIRTEVIAGATCHFISDLCFWVSIEGLQLKLDNVEAVNTFSKNGYREEKVVEEWPKAMTLPERIYFIKRNNSTSCAKVEILYQQEILRVELNTLAAFNAKYPDFYKNFSNGIQRKDVDGKFCCAVFGSWGGGPNVDVRRGGGDWFGDWWFVGVCKYFINKNKNYRDVVFVLLKNQFYDIILSH